MQTPAIRLARGTVLAGRYEIIEEIGRGGMGAVYKAHDSKIDEILALKILKPEIASSPEIIERFRSEIRLARKVAHRHVCRTYDIGEDGLTAYISMEYVPGENLKSFIRRSGIINEAKTLDLARQITQGLTEAHRLGVVHRDLKSQNIMIDRDGNAKIMDFGIARSLHDKSRTGTGVIIGTPEYMAPEQLDGPDVDQRADIYALGVIFFEMATGRLPFQGETPLSVALKHKNELPADPAQINEKLSPGISRIILKCLEKDRNNRYRDASELMEDLNLAVSDTSVRSPAPAGKTTPLSGKTAVKAGSKKAIAWISLALVAAVLFLVIKSMYKPAAQVVKQIPRIQEMDGPAAKSLPADMSRAGISNLVSLFSDHALSPKEVEEVDEVMSAIRKVYPELAGFTDSIQDRIEEITKLRAAGDLQGSRKAMGKGESEMKRLLVQVNQRDKAELALKSLNETKKKAARALAGRPSNLLTWIAREKEKDATDAFGKGDFSGARILYEILERIHEMSTSGGNEEDCLAALGEFATKSRDEAFKSGAPQKEGWLFERAREEEAEAGRLSKENHYSLAAEKFILAVFLYRKATEVALESTQVPQ